MKEDAGSGRRGDAETKTTAKNYRPLLLFPRVSASPRLLHFILHPSIVTIALTGLVRLIIKFDLAAFIEPA